MTAKPEAGGSGLIDVTDLRPVLRELPDQLVHRMGVGGNDAVGTYDPGGVGDRDGDGFGVDIQADLFDLRDCG